MKTALDYPLLMRDIQKVTKNLQKEANKIQGNTLKGLVKGMILIMNDTEKTAPLTPRVTGNLRASRFIIHSAGNINVGANIEEGKAPIFKNLRKDKKELVLGHRQTISSIINEVSTSKQPMVVGGFSAYYAPFVHEKVDATFRENQGAKFLESSVRRNRIKVLDTIAKEAKK